MKVAQLIGSNDYLGTVKGSVVAYASEREANQMAFELNNYEATKMSRDVNLKFISQEDEFKHLPSHDYYFVEVVEVK